MRKNDIRSKHLETPVSLSSSLQIFTESSGMFVVSTEVMTSSFHVVYPEINWIKKHWTSNTSKLTLPIWVDDGLESIITKTTQTSLSLLRWWGKGRLGRGHTLGRYAGNVLTDKKLREMICQFEEGIAGSLGGPGHYCSSLCDFLIKINKNFNNEKKNWTLLLSFQPEDWPIV